MPDGYDPSVNPISEYALVYELKFKSWTNNTIFSFFLSTKAFKAPSYLAGTNKIDTGLTKFFRFWGESNLKPVSR